MERANLRCACYELEFMFLTCVMCGEGINEFTWVAEGQESTVQSSCGMILYVSTNWV